MIKRITRPILLFSFIFLFAAWTPSPKDGVTVYVFLGEKCIISQYYTLTLRQLHETYASEQIQFIGVFPNPDASLKGIQQFKEKYKIPFDLILDEQQAFISQYQIKVTPEILVTSDETVLYQGRIDNTYFRVGKRRSITTTAELKEVLQAIDTQSTIPIQKTEAIGCLITPVNPILKGAIMCKPQTTTIPSKKN